MKDRRVLLVLAASLVVQVVLVVTQLMTLSRLEAVEDAARGVTKEVELVCDRVFDVNRSVYFLASPNPFTREPQLTVSDC